MSKSLFINDASYATNMATTEFVNNVLEISGVTISNPTLNALLLSDGTSNGVVSNPNLNYGTSFNITGDTIVNGTMIFDDTLILSSTSIKTVIPPSGGVGHDLEIKSDSDLNTTLAGNLRISGGSGLASGGGVTIEGGECYGVGNSGNVVINGGTAGLSENAQPGDVIINAGTSGYLGEGEIKIGTTHASNIILGTSTTIYGDLYFKSGSDRVISFDGEGSDSIILQSSNSSISDGGSVNIIGGEGLINGGDINIIGGDTSEVGYAGDVFISGGASPLTPYGEGGSVYIDGGLGDSNNECNGSIYVNYSGTTLDFIMMNESHPNLFRADFKRGRIHMGTDSNDATNLGVVTISNNLSWNSSPYGHVDNLHLPCLRTVGDGVIGGSISFSGPSTIVRQAVIGSIQETAFSNYIGLSFWTHNSSSVAVAVQESMRLSHDGQLDVIGNVVSYSSMWSDVRLKKDINILENALSKVLKLDGVSYKRISNDELHFGYIAQEVEKIIPEVILEKPMPLETGNSEDLYLSVRYTEIIPLITEAIKEQQRIIDKQQIEIENLKNKIQ